jgi:zinc and cadmium transporter
MLLASIVLATVLGGLLSMAVAGLIVAGLPQRWLPRLVGFATGVLLAVAFLDVLPEAIESTAEPQKIFSTLLIGILAFFGLERIAIWRHAHPGEDAHLEPETAGFHHHHHIGRDTVLSVMVGDGFHNMVDGVMLAATFLVSPALGWTTTLGVIAHEIPQEAGDFALLRTAGLTVKRALMFNAASSLMSIAGGILGYFSFSHLSGLLPYCLSVAAASFMYIAISDLLPLLRREAHFGTSVAQIIAMLIGIVLVALAGLLH